MKYHRCKHCKYFREHPKENYGWCYRFPPQVVNDRIADINSKSSCYPAIDKDSFSCGELELKKPYMKKE